MAVGQTGNLRFLPKSRELIEIPDLDDGSGVARSAMGIEENERKIKNAREMLGLSPGCRLPHLLIDMPPGRVVIFSGEHWHVHRALVSVLFLCRDDALS